MGVEEWSGRDNYNLKNAIKGKAICLDIKKNVKIWFNSVFKAIAKALYRIEMRKICIQEGNRYFSWRLFLEMELDVQGLRA